MPCLGLMITSDENPCKKRWRLTNRMELREKPRDLKINILLKKNGSLQSKKTIMVTLSKGRQDG